MAADPRFPAAPGRAADERVFDGGLLVAWEHRARLRFRQAGRVVGLEHVDPPVLARRGRGGADVQPPAALVGPDERRLLERLRTEAILLDRADRFERLAVVGTCDDVRAAAFRAGPDAIGEDVRAVGVERGMRRPRPPTDTAPGSGDRADRRRTAREGEVTQSRSRSGSRPALPSTR